MHTISTISSTKASTWQPEHSHWDKNSLVFMISKTLQFPKIEMQWVWPVLSLFTLGKLYGCAVLSDVWHEQVWHKVKKPPGRWSDKELSAISEEHIELLENGLRCVPQIRSRRWKTVEKTRREQSQTVVFGTWEYENSPPWHSYCHVTNVALRLAKTAPEHRKTGARHAYRLPAADVSQ